MWLRIDSSVATRLYITWIPEPKQSPPTEKKGKTLHICVYFCLQNLETKSRNHITHAHCSTHLDCPSRLLVSPQTYYQGEISFRKTILATYYFFKDPQSYHHLSLTSPNQIKNKREKSLLENIRRIL